MNIAIIRDTKRVKRTPTTVDKDGTMYRYSELESEVSDAHYNNIMMAIQYESLLLCTWYRYCYWKITNWILFDNVF